MTSRRDQADPATPRVEKECAARASVRIRATILFVTCTVCEIGLLVDGWTLISRCNGSSVWPTFLSSQDFPALNQSRQTMSVVQFVRSSANN